MNVPLPGGLIAIFISLSLFYYFNQKTRIRKEGRREKLKEKHQEYLDSLLADLSKKVTKNKNDSIG